MAAAPTAPVPSVDELVSLGLANGLHRVGIASAEPFTATFDDLVTRAERGLAADMQFTYRNPARSTEPERALPGVASLVVGARAYPPPPTVEAAPGGTGVTGRVAAYAVGDHYGALRAGLDAIADRLRQDGHRALVLLDDNALVDRAAAHRAGLGWFGKNANLLVDEVGSWVVLGSVLTDASLPPAPAPVPDGCGACTRCLTGCPTEAIVEPGVVDARRCLAWQLQAAGPFPPDLRVALGDRLYGCDECQAVCPPSRRAVRVDPPRRGPAVAATTPEQLDVVELLGLDDDELLARVGRWYIAHRDPAVVRRNALLVLGNAAPLPLDARVEAVLADNLAHPDPRRRAPAVWAARRLGRDDLLDGLAHDADAEVRDELARVVPARAGSSAATPGPGARPR